MIQGGFEGFVGAKTTRLSDGQFGVGVHALYGAGGDLPFGNEPVEDEVVVTPEGTRDLLHRLQSGAQGAGTPLVEEQLAQRALSYCQKASSDSLSR